MSSFKKTKTALTFKGGSYKKRADGQAISFNDVALDTALVSITKTKKIIRSEISGKDGDVIEYIGMASADISIQGIITGENGIEPKAFVDALNAVIDAPIAIDIVCPFLNSKGVFKIVITDSTLPQEAGGISYQVFTISAIAETPIELRIKNV